MNIRLMILVLSGLAALAAPSRAQSAALESLREAVTSRWDFQKRFPLAGRLFENLATDAERTSLIAQLRPLAQAADADAVRASAAGPIPGALSPEILNGIWTGFALGLASEKSRPGAGDAELESAARMAKGNLGVNYEQARILGASGMYQRARARQSEVHRSMLEKGYMRMPDLAKLELWKAAEAMRQGRFQVARQSLDFAGRLDPFCPWVPFQGVLLHFREKTPLSWNPGFVWTSAGEILRLAGYYDVQSLLLVNLSRCLRFGFGIFGALCLLALFARHFPGIAHPWAEKLPHAVEMRVRYLAIALVPFSLAVGGAGYVLLGLLMVMLVWKHASTGEKSALKAFMTGIALVPFLIMFEGAMCRHLDGRTGVNLYHLSWTRGYERALAERALSFPARQREDSLYRALSLSLQYKKQGNYQRASEFGREASRIDPGNPYTLINAGSLNLAAFEYPKAVSASEKARRSAPGMVETWFNSSQAELYSNNSAGHKRFLDRAAEMDPQWVTQWLKDNDQNFPVYPGTRKAMDPMLRPGQAWTTAWQSLLAMDFLGLTLHAGIVEMRGSWMLIIVVLASLALYFRFRQFSRHSHGWDLFECRICGRVMCRTCRKGVHCQTCFKTVAGVHDNRIRSELVSRLRNRSALLSVRSASGLDALFPGIGHLYLGRGGGRFFWPLAVSLIIGSWWGLNHVVMEYPAFVLGPLRWLPALPLAALYGVFNLKQLRSPLTLDQVMPAQAAQEKAAAR